MKKAALSLFLGSLALSPSSFAHNSVVLEGEHLIYSTPNEKLLIVIRRAEKSDLETMAQINFDAFPGDNRTIQDSRDWISEHMESPSSHYYVITYIDSQGHPSPALGYTFWEIKGGYKPNLAVEMEQMVIDKNHRGERFGLAVLWYSAGLFEKDIQESRHNLDLKIDTIAITTGDENRSALGLYEKAFGAKNFGRMGPVYGGSDKYGSSEFSLVSVDAQPFLNKNRARELFMSK